MARLSTFSSLCIVVMLLAALPANAQAAQPSETLLPNTTKGFISIPDVVLLEKKWNETQYGQLMDEPSMKEFGKDLKRQLSAKLNQAGTKLALTIDDLRDIAGGEVAVARIQPDNDVKKYAVAMLADVTGHVDQANELLAKISKDLKDRGGKEAAVTMGGVKVVTFTMPKKKDQPAATQVFYVIHEDQLIATDHEATCAGILSRFDGAHKDALSNVPAFRESMSRCLEASGEMVAQARWFVEPFGYIETIRSQRGDVKRRGADLMKHFSNTGFRAIQGAGGHVSFATGEQEALHHTFIYAPGDKELAAKMLDFPNGSGLTAQSWIPRNGASYLTFKWNLKAAFEASKWLFDDIAGEKIFDEVLKSIAKDPAGPMIDIRKELINHLSDRVTVITDYRLPITPKSERYLVAIEVKNEAVVKSTINRAMEHDPQAIKRTLGEHVIWEIVNEPEPEDENDFPRIDGVPALGPLGIGNDDDEDEKKEERTLPNSAVTVVRGSLVIASHVDYIRDMLAEIEQADTLSASADYQVVNDALEKLGAKESSYKAFGRTDEVIRATYELIKHGKMPEAETMLGKMINKFFESGEEGVLREQSIDGSKLPDFQLVRRYLGPSGLFVKTQDDGWFVTGCFLTKEMR